MPDTVTVTSRQSWFSRIGQSIAGVGIGLLLVVAAFPLLWWNEGRAVHRARSLQEGAQVVVDVGPDAVDPAHEGRLVHLTGLATSDETLADPDLGITAGAIRLVRVAETYQWRESKSTHTRKRLGGGEETTTTYSYAKTWSSDRIDSSDFHEQGGHQNPALAWESKSVTAARVALGAFTLPRELVDKIGGRTARPTDASDIEKMRARGFVAVDGGNFFKGRTTSDPQVGDVRVRFEVITPQTVSLVAAQRGSTFETYQARAGSGILLLEQGAVSAEQMFKAARTQNTILTWALRAGGLFAMFIGFVLILKPISVIASVVPFVGTLLGAGTGMIAFFVALALSLTTMALAWLAYRPLLGGSLLALAAGSLVLLVRRHARRKKIAGPALPPPIPPVLPPPIPQR